MKKLFSRFGVLLLKMVGYLPLWFLYIFADVIYFLLWYIVKYRKKVVRNNLRKSFPSKSEEEIRHIAKKYYAHFADLLVETPKLYTFSKKEVLKRVVYKNPEVLNELFRKGKNTALVGAHYGNWEWMSSLSYSSEYAVNTIYKPLNNKVFNEYMKQSRTRFGVEVYSMEDSYRMIIGAQKKGLSMSCFIADQSPIESKYWTTFLNQESGIFLGPEKIASKLKMAVVFCDCMKIKRGYYEVTFTKICDDASLTNEFEVTDAHVRMLEKTITNRPEYWIWSHRRWKRKRPEGVPLH